jgi:uncharacterized membrane protein YkvA (DUF1232 family)
MAEEKPSWLENSRAYQKARKLVQTTLNSPELLRDLIANAQSKVSRDRNGKLSEMFDSVTAAFRLLKAYSAGEYRQISFESLALIVSSMIYFVMPIDAIPDFILAFGFVDDAALLAWTFRSVSQDIENFILWEKQLPTEQDSES